ncbi:hypothetical protein NP493_179g01048 [Ridgeia piscesae]|uniref:Endonuclease/exonuclease/phosphatase domain-containing protein n=1 Tax=Ridgeia piscesae TaxID=27915 RepID=A0AAD9P2S6_RIDPI|nr:hypothetical protein NP493_179g01048 [Ridgeia piscesae]
METTTRGPIADLSQPGSMTTPAESLHQEGRCATDSLLGPKTKISIGTWNVRTMNEASKLAQVIREMKRYRLDILGVSECRWTGSGRQVSHDGSTILYSGHEDTHIRGVALVISKQKANTLLEWEPISDRIMKARFNSKHCKLTIILCYAPTNASDKEDKEDWYEQLQQAVAKVSQYDMLLIIGDMNAKVGSDNSNCERAMGKHGCGVMNDNGERLVDYCLNNNYVIGGTIFAHRDIHKLTWKSPDEETDHDATNKWDTTKKTYIDVATKVLGHKKKNHKEWLTPETWKKIEERKQLKIKPDELADPPPVPDDLNIDTSPPTEAEVKNALKAMKSG